MADLTTAPATGSQSTTQNPQTVPSAQTIGGASKQSAGVQPGTATSLLNSQNGVSLSATPLTIVDLSNTEASTAITTKSDAASIKPTHHVNTALIAISIGLVVVAIGLFWAIQRSAKSTTNY